MCIAIAQPEGTATLPFSIFEECAKTNKHGLGMAWIDWKREPEKRLRIWRSTQASDGSFDVRHFWEKYRIAHIQWGKESPFMMHFRYTTHGLTNKYNCHPFRVKPMLAMVHNGILPIPPKGRNIKNLFHGDDVLEEYSDTWHYANWYFSKFDYEQFHGGMLSCKKTLQEHTEDFIGVGNKLVFLDANRYEKPRNLLIYNEKQGTWDGGVWYSNSGYKSWSGYGSCGTYNRRSAGWWRGEDYDSDWVKCRTSGCVYFCQRPETHCFECRREMAKVETKVDLPKVNPDDGSFCAMNEDTAKPVGSDTRFYPETKTEPTRTVIYCRYPGCMNTVPHPNHHYCDSCLQKRIEENKQKRAQLKAEISKKESECTESKK